MKHVDQEYVTEVRKRFQIYAAYLEDEIRYNDAVNQPYYTQSEDNRFKSWVDAVVAALQNLERAYDIPLSRLPMSPPVDRLQPTDYEIPYDNLWYDKHDGVWYPGEPDEYDEPDE